VVAAEDHPGERVAVLLPASSIPTILDLIQFAGGRT
jgi:hypothetical protein